MRTKILYIKKAFPLLLSGIFILLLSACGTHNNGYGDTDGIYSSEKTTETNDTANENEVDKTNYYKQYFKSKNGTYDELPEEGAVFTDIEAYSTTDTLDEDGYIVTEENTDYGSWGSNSDNVTVNVYNYGGYGYGYWNRPYWYGGWGYPYYWSSPYWGISYGWGHPYYYGGYYYSPYYGGYYNPYYSHGYYNSVAYNRGRRNLDYTSSRDAYRGRRDNYSRTDSYRRTDGRDVRPNTRPRTRPQSQTRPSSGTRPQVNTRPRTRPSTQTRPQSQSRPKVNNSSQSRPQVNNRSSSSSRGGSVRSTGSSSRSSGSRSGGSRRGGGRN